jgi:hypothetical protein
MGNLDGLAEVAELSGTFVPTAASANTATFAPAGYEFSERSPAVHRLRSISAPATLLRRTPHAVRQVGRWLRDKCANSSDRGVRSTSTDE